MPVSGGDTGENDYGGGYMQDPRYATPYQEHAGSQDPRYVNPPQQPTAGGDTGYGDMSFQNQQYGGARFAPRGPRQFGPPQGGGMPTTDEGNYGGGNMQDPRYANPYQQHSGGQDPRWAVQPPQPAGMRLRRPGSGGSRVMRRPTAGQRNRLQRGVYPAGNSGSKKMGY